RTLPVRALRGQGPMALAASVLRLPASLLAARRIVREVRPDLLIGVGGYASAPAGVAGWSGGTPTGLLGRTARAGAAKRGRARPGATNRVLARLADRICVAFPESARYFPAERTTLTGNPVRPPVSQAKERGEGFCVLIFGGSAGAHRLNEVGVAALALMAEKS